MFERINVLVSAYCVDSADVGEAKMAYEWINRLAEFANLTVITTGSRLNKTCGLEENNNINLIKIKHSVSFKWCDSFDRAVHPGYVEYFFKAKRIVNELINKNNIKLCHHIAPRSLRYPCPFIDAAVPYIAGPFHGGLESPAVMKELGCGENLFFKLRSLDGLRMSYDPWLKKHYENASRIIVSAPYVKKLLPEKYSAKTDVIYGVGIEESSLDFLEKDGNSQEFKLIFVGRLVSSKGLEILLSAISLLKNKNIKLIICGVGSQEEYFKQLACKFGIGDKLEWKGFVNNKEVLKLYKQSDVFAFPSLKEPAGIAVIEAMSKGLPVLTVDYGGPAYSVDDTCGIKIPLSDKQTMSQKFAEAVEYLANNPATRKQMAVNAVKRVQDEFVWNKLIGKMLKVYNDIAGKI